MKNLFVFIILSFSIQGFKSQQNQLFNQSLFNYYQLNSAYAGSKNITAIGLGINKQWVSVEGAPFSQYLSFHTSLGEKKVGLGILLSNESIGVHRVSSIEGTFAYHIQSNRGLFSLALDIGIEQVSFNFSDLFLQQNDLALAQQGNLNSIIPKFNFSGLYQNNRIIVGVKLSNLLQSDFKLSELGVARQFIHADLLLGFARPLSKNLVWKPYLLVNATETNQFAFDLSSNFTLMDKITFGLSYRNDKNLNLISHFFVRKNIRVGYSYEISLTSLITNKPNSHEIFMGINLGKEKGSVVSPRFYSL